MSGNHLSREIQEWGSNPRGDFFAGVVSAFAVIPEVIGFTIVAGVDPILGLYTSVAFLLLMSFIGGCPAMVSAGAGSMAVLVAALIADHGLEYMFAAVILAGVLQLILGLIGIGGLLRRMPKSVIVGFVDGLAIIIFMSQMTSLMENMGDGALSISLMLAFVLIGLIIIVVFPKISTVIPSTLVAIFVVTAISVILNSLFGISDYITMISNLGEISAGWPDLHIPRIFLEISTWQIILPYAISLAFVGLLETSLTAQVVDNLTQTVSQDKRECCSQGACNIVCGSIGAMPGCAMIGQAVACVKSGGRGRLSTFVAGLVLALLLAFGSDLLGLIPLAALISVMLFVCFNTFDWSNLKEMTHKRDRNSVCATAVTLLTVGVVVLTSNLAYGAVAGLLLALAFWLIYGKDRTYKVL